jgi:nucleoside-diphosphate-sugar epimerase
VRIIVLGGTRFIGRAITEELVGHGHQVMVVHRGRSEPEAWVDVEHLHVDRAELGTVSQQLLSFVPDAAIDCLAMTGADAEAALAVLPAELRLVVLSSMDVYRAYGAVQADRVDEPVPLYEDSPVRDGRYPYRGQIPGMDDYEKLDVEEAYLGRRATVCRLPMVYGEHDGQRREWPILRRVHAGRTRIPIGAGTWVTTWGYVGDVASGVRLVVECEAAAGEIFNLGASRSPTIELWARQVLAAAESDAELVHVPDELLPEDLGITAAIAQPLLCDSAKARSVLGWREVDPAEALRRSVAWHLANPPDADLDFEADDRALAGADPA